MKKKGIILEQHRKYTILLTKDGSFEKGIVTGEKVEIGEEVYYKPVKRSVLFMKMDRKYVPLQVLALACIILLCFLPFYFFPTTNTYAYVTVDINPSIEIAIDETYVVQSIRPVNTDASLVTDRLTNVKNQTLEAVIQKIIHKSEEMALVNDDKNVLVGISFYKDQAPNKKEIIYEVEEQLGEMEPEWNIAMFHVPEEIRLLADEKNTSMNKMLANEFTVEPLADKDFHSDYIIDDEEIELISSYYQSSDEKKEEKKIEIMSEPMDETESDIEKSGSNIDLMESDNGDSSPYEEATLEQEELDDDPNQDQASSPDIYEDKTDVDSNRTPQTTTDKTIKQQE